MKPRLMTPGPTPVPEETLLDLARPAFYHRSAEFREMLGEVVKELKYVFQTANDVIVLTASGTGGMEAAVSNCLAPGQKAILNLCGRWSERWRNICKAFNVTIVPLEVPEGEANSPDRLAAALAEHPDASAVFATFSETSTSVVNDLKSMGSIVAKSNALFIVDSISGLGTMECRTDDWGIDVNVTGSQKALMMPPGLAYLSISKKAWKAIDANAAAKTFYFDLKKYRKSMADSDTPFTPAHTMIRAQLVSLKKMRAEGIEKIWKRHAGMAAVARAGIEGMGLELFAKAPGDGLTAIRVPGGVDGSAALKKLQKDYGVKLADGQDQLKGKIWRMAHMGYIDVFDVLAALSGLELVLLQMGHTLVPGAGVAAAQREMVDQVMLARAN